MAAAPSAPSAACTSTQSSPELAVASSEHSTLPSAAPLAAGSVRRHDQPQLCTTSCRSSDAAAGSGSPPPPLPPPDSSRVTRHACRSSGCSRRATRQSTSNALVEASSTALTCPELTQSRQPLATSPSGDQHSPRIGSLDGHAEKSGAAACSPLPPSSSSFSGKPPRPRFLPARSRSADAALPAPLRSRALDWSDCAVTSPRISWLPASKIRTTSPQATAILSSSDHASALG